MGAAPFGHDPQNGGFPLGNVSSGIGREDVCEHWQSEPQTVKFRGIDGLTLIADEWNRDATSDPARPAILFLHGGGQNRFSWKNTGQILADEGLHVIALDCRGHGDSDRSPDANYTVDALCADTCGARPDRPAGDPDRGQHGRDDRHPRR